MTIPAIDPDRPPTVPTDFDAFYAARFADAARLAHLLTGDASVCEDLAQEALTRVHPKFATLDDPWPYLRVAVVKRAAATTAAGRGSDRGPGSSPVEPTMSSP